MARRAPVASDEDGSDAEAVMAKKQSTTVKREGRKTRVKVQLEQQPQKNEDEEVSDEDQDAEGEAEEQDEEEGDHTGTPKGAKRRRINVDGDSVPSRPVSQEEEDAEAPATQLPNAEFKTLPRDADGCVLIHSIMIHAC
jgi:hypothetical protein